MPEVPELQAHAERIEADFGGAVLAGFRPITFTALKTYAPDPASLVGRTLRSVGRRGKYLLLDFDDATFVVHLMQGGRLKPDEKQSAKPRGGIARWTFEDGRALLLTEPGTERKAGVWVVAGDLATQEPLAGLGPEAASLGAAELGELLAAHPMRLHGFLRDQRIVAGLGRRLANEICHRAQLSPFAGTAKLDGSQVERLVEAIAACVAESLAAERARDEMVRSSEREGAVHHRVGEPCPVCGDTIRSVEYRAYTVAYCPTCQTGGRVLADNTTSRFLK
ncbi:MAG: DNA-formamidopyrimidine glycosylase family protein [Acidimicrobiales bacterium]|nr:Fpg/Nei family DNA glycosylase [Actinomycetota bacterium]